MKKLAIVYWSQSGNTQAMAQAVLEGAAEAGADAKLINVSDITAEDAAEYPGLLLGCPAMGAEVLEKSEFEPFFTALEGHISGKSVGLFGSYGWGDGQWMRDWEKRVKNAGGLLYQDKGLMINETPDADGLAACKTFGGGFAAS